MLHTEWNYNARNTISFYVSEMSFIYLLTNNDSANDQNIMRRVIKATFTPLRSKYASKTELETALSSLL